MQPQPTISPQQIADRLGEIRALVRGLKAEESRLRQALLDARLNGPIKGVSFQVSIQQRRTRRFDHTRLPEEIAGNPLYWKIATSQAVITRPLDKANTLPLARENRGQTLPHPPSSSRSEVQVIEPF